MRMIHSFKARRFIIAGVFFASLGFGTTVSAEALRYLLDLNGKTVTQLGSLAYHAQADSNYVAAINNAGQVLAIGLIPEPETYALMLAGLGPVGFVARRKRVHTGSLYDARIMVGHGLACAN